MIMRKNPILQTPRFQNLTPDLVQELDALKSHLEKPSRASGSYESGSSFGEHTISLYEVLARVHGPNIVPQINSIMSSIVRTLKSSSGSLPLHQACSKVAPAIARYAIDPSTNSSTKENIITSICKPLSDVLMDYNESVASGSALCLQILAECENWRFASDEMVNEVCLRVSGALEEDKILTNAHFGLVMALSKCNALVLEAYSRSLIRSGLRIIQKNDLERNSQRRFSAIQMINFLIKCVDSRSVVSELGSVMDVMEKLEEDPLMFIRGAAFEALEIAKRVIAQENLRSKELPETPLSGRILGLASPESRSVDSFLPSGGFPSSLQSSALQSRRSGRRLWTDYRDSDYNSNGRINPPQPASPILMKNMKMFITPRRLIRSIQSPGESQSDAAMWDPAEAPPENAKTPMAHDEGEENSESVSSCGEIPEEVEEESEGLFEDAPSRKRVFCRLTFTFVTSLLSIMAGISLLVNQIHNDENTLGAFPT